MVAQRAEFLMMMCKREKKNTQEPTRPTHSNASQMLLWFSLLIFHGAIYYCRTHDTTQAISLLDDLYLILKSVLHKYGTVRFQPHLITRCHGGTSITGMMRIDLIHSPGLPLIGNQHNGRKCTQLHRFLSLLVSSQFLEIGLKTRWRRFLILSISTIAIQGNLAIHRTVGSLWIFSKTHDHVFQSCIHVASLPCYLHCVSLQFQKIFNPTATQTLQCPSLEETEF